MLAQHREEVMRNLVQSYNKDGTTTLLLAIQKRDLDLVQVLIEELKASRYQPGRDLCGKKKDIHKPCLRSPL